MSKRLSADDSRVAHRSAVTAIPCWSECGRRRLAPADHRAVDPAFQREKAHYSNLFWGVSVAALEHLAARKGYAFLGSNTAGNNLCSVRNDRLGRLTPVSVVEAYVESRFRESRDVAGKLNCLGGNERCLGSFDIPVVDVVSRKTTTMRALDALAA